MNPRTCILFGIGALALSGCIIIDANETGRENLHIQAQYGLLKLQSVSIGQDAVDVEISAACATRQNIYPNVEQYGRRQYEIGFDYADRGTCNEESPGQTRLSWSYDELGIPLDSTVSVLNVIAR